MLNKLFLTTAQVAVLFLVVVVFSSSTSANPICKCEDQSEDSSSKKVVDFNVHISEAGEKYNEKIEVDRDKQTELFEVPAHPGVDRSDVLHDFKQNLTMMRFPDNKTCYLFPLVNEQSAPEKLIQDLEKASKMVITETRRVDTTWIIDGELTDRSVLSDELAQFCAKYGIYHVKKTPDSSIATRIEKEERTNRKRRQSGISRLCPGSMNRNRFLNSCPVYYHDLRCRVISINCYKSVICKGNYCRQEHIWTEVRCCKYFCNDQFKII